MVLCRKALGYQLLKHELVNPRLETNATDLHAKRKYQMEEAKSRCKYRKGATCEQNTRSLDQLGHDVAWAVLAVDVDVIHLG